MAKIQLLPALGGAVVAVGGGFVVYDTITNGEVQIPSWVWYAIGITLLLVGVGLIFGQVKPPKVTA